MKKMKGKINKISKEKNRNLTPEEKLWYHTLIKNAEQIAFTLEDGELIYKE